MGNTGHEGVREIREGILGNMGHEGVREIRGTGPSHSAGRHPPKNYLQPATTLSGHALTQSHLTDPLHPYEHRAETQSLTSAKECTNGTDKAFSFMYTC